MPTHQLVSMENLWDLTQVIFESKQPDSDGSTRLTQAEVDKLRKAIRDAAP